MSNKVKEYIINLKNWQLYRIIDLYENGLLSIYDGVVYSNRVYIMISNRKKKYTLILVYKDEHDLEVFKHRTLITNPDILNVNNIEVNTDYIWSDNTKYTFLSYKAEILCRLYKRCDKYDLVFSKSGMDLAFKLVMYNQQKAKVLLSYLYPKFDQKIKITVNKVKSVDPPSIAIICDLPRYVVANFIKQMCIYDNFDNALDANKTYEID